MKGFVLNINDVCCSKTFEEGKNIGFTITRFSGVVKLFLSEMENSEPFNSKELYCCELKLGDNIKFRLDDVVMDFIPEVNASDSFDEVDIDAKEANLLRRYLAFKEELLKRGCKLEQILLGVGGDLSHYRQYTSVGNAFLYNNEKILILRKTNSLWYYLNQIKIISQI